MDKHQLFRDGLAYAVELSYNSASTSAPAYTEWESNCMKLNTGNSPNSPLSSPFDPDTLSSRSNSKELYDSAVIISAIDPSVVSLETDSSLTKSAVFPRDSIPLHSEPHYVVSDHSMKHALQELETVLMAGDETKEPTTSTNPDSDERELVRLPKQPSRTMSKTSHLETHTIHPHHLPSKYLKPSHEASPAKRPKEMAGIPQSYVKEFLIKCAEALSDDKIDEFKMLVQETRGVVSINGEPIQRLGAYMLEGLVARNECSGTNIYRALRCRQPESKELLSYMRILFDICPYFKFGYMAANGAIAEALKNEDRIHIIDFQIAQGTQWVTLIQALAARPGGPPRVRITGIDDPVSEFARGDNLDIVGKMLSDMSKKFNIPLEFNALPVYGPQVTRDMLEIQPGEAVAVNFTLQLHHTPDESVDVNNPRDGLLRMVKGLSPKVTTLVEQESNTNTTPFLTRFMETLDYYSAMFESIDVTLPRESKERISVEQHCLAKDIVNVIACEGKDRVERHELLGKWRSRLGMAGFKPYPLSSYVNSVIRALLACYSDNYTLAETDGALLLGWKNRNLISASAWR